MTKRTNKLKNAMKTKINIQFLPWRLIVDLTGYFVVHEHLDFVENFGLGHHACRDVAAFPGVVLVSSSF